MRLKTKFELLVLAVCLVSHAALGAVGGAVSGTTKPGTGSGSVRTNSDQFLGVPLSLKSGFKATNEALYPSGSSAIPLTIRAAAGQDGDLIRLYDSSSSVLGGFLYDGSVYGPGGGGPKFAVVGTAGQVWTETGSGIGGWQNISTTSAPFQRGTNQWFDAGVASVYTNLVYGSVGGSNLMFTNMVGPLDIYLFASPGASLGMPQIPASSYTGGAVIEIGTNCITRIQVRVVGGVTNVTVFTDAYTEENGTGFTSVTNRAARTITRSATAATPTGMMYPFACDAFSWAFSEVRYVGRGATAAARLDPLQVRCEILKAGTIKAVSFHNWNTVAGVSTEYFTNALVVNGSTIVATSNYTYAATTTNVTVTGLSQAVSVGDTLVWRIIAPDTLGTPPTCYLSCLVYVE